MLHHYPICIRGEWRVVYDIPGTLSASEVSVGGTEHRNIAIAERMNREQAEKDAFYASLAPSERRIVPGFYSDAQP